MSFLTRARGRNLRCLLDRNDIVNFNVKSPLNKARKEILNVFFTVRNVTFNNFYTYVHLYVCMSTFEKYVDIYMSVCPLLKSDLWDPNIDMIRLRRYVIKKYILPN